MKVNLRDRLSFQEMNHRGVHAYLLGQGWRVVDQIGDKAHVVAITDDGNKKSV